MQTTLVLVKFVQQANTKMLRVMVTVPSVSLDLSAQLLRLRVYGALFPPRPPQAVLRELCACVMLDLLEASTLLVVALAQPVVRANTKP